MTMQLLVVDLWSLFRCIIPQFSSLMSCFFSAHTAASATRPRTERMKTMRMMMMMMSCFSGLKALKSAPGRSAAEMSWHKPVLVYKPDLLDFCCVEMAAQLDSKCIKVQALRVMAHGIMQLFSVFYLLMWLW